MKKYKEQVFLICIFLTGLLTVFPYGAHLDQTTEQQIMYSNIKTYLGCLGGTKSDFYHQLDMAGIIDISESMDRYNGMVVYYPIFWIFYANQASSYAANIIWHLYIYIVVFGGIVALFKLLLELLDSFKISAAATAMLFFTPRMFAESHYNNKDMVLLSLVLCVFYFGWKFLKEKSWSYAIAFSMAGSFAANMKVVGILIWGFVGVYIFFALLCTRQMNRKIWKKMFWGIFLTVFFYIAVTPACWKGFWEFICYLFESAKNFRWNDYVLFEGSMYNKSVTGIPRRYLPTMILLTVPVGILLLALAGLPEIVIRLCRKPSDFGGVNTGYGCTVILAGMVPLGYAVLSGTPVYNGWRHFYFCYASIIVSVAYGISFLQRIAVRAKKLFLADFVLAAYLLALVLGIAVNYPYEYAYYNFLAGSNIESKYELDYWDMSFRQAYSKILESTEEETIKIGTVSNPAMWGMESQIDTIQKKQRERISLCDNWQDAEYIMINPMYAYMYGSDDYDRIKQNYRLMDKIQSYGNVICEIYQK